MTYSKLKNLLIQATKAYYIDSNPIMSDYEFDMKLKELEKMEEAQGYADPDSPTQKPGSDITSEKDTKNSHGRPMLSLENTYNFDEVEKWYNDMVKACRKNPEVVVNPKWDGGSGALRYSEGKLYKALTRGNGQVGEDITQNIQYCDENIWAPKMSRIGMSTALFNGEARGEIIMTTAGFAELNKDNKYQNARNLVSGSLKLLDIYEFIPRSNTIKFIAYWLENSNNTKYSDDLTELKRFGFEVGDFYICHNLEEIKDAINKIEKDKFDIAIDGAVMKLNDKTMWNLIGSTAKYPRWAKAYKYKQESVETVVKDITFEVGRTGKITPLCWFEPVFLDGSTIQKATLNNKEFMESMDIAIGDTVEVQKAAAIIPQIMDVVFRPNNRRVVKFPTVCPNCGSTLIKHNEEHADWYCDNSDCSARIVDQIINYTHAIECDGFAEIIVERLHSANLLNSITDLYDLKNHKEEISKLDRLSMNIAEKLCKNLEDTKQTDLWKILSGLGIPNVGPKTAKILAKKFKSIRVIQKLTTAELEAVEDIAEITSKGIVNWFNNHSYLIDKLESKGVRMSEEVESKSNIDLEGKSFCITGALSRPRKDYEEMIEAANGKNVSSVSTKTNYLVTNDKTSGSSKNKKAAELGIPVIDESELLKLLGE